MDPGLWKYPASPEARFDKNPAASKHHAEIATKFSARRRQQATTVGLVTAEEFKKARVLAETGVGDKEAKGADGEDGASGEANIAEKRKKKRRKKKLISTLSFGEEIDEDDGIERGDSSGEAGVVEKVGVAWSQQRDKGNEERGRKTYCHNDNAAYSSGQLDNEGDCPRVVRSPWFWGDGNLVALIVALVRHDKIGRRVHPGVAV